MLEKGCTVSLKGFKYGGKSVEGLVRFSDKFSLILEPKKEKKSTTKTNKSDKLTCPKCKKGTILKGKTAYGCSNWQSGCKFRFPFEEVRSRAGKRALTKALVKQILYT